MSTEDPVRRLLLSLDVQHYGEGDDNRQQLFQETLTEVVGKAAHAAGMDERVWEIQRSGDGILAVLPAADSESRLVDLFVRSLDEQLTRFNRDRKRRACLRLRVAIHHGPIAPSANGYVGEGVLTVSRLVDSAALRSALLRHRNASVAVAVTDPVFQGTIARGRTTVDRSQFARTAIEAKEYRGFAWIRVVGVASAPSPSAPPDGRPHSGKPQNAVGQHATAGNSVQQAGRDLIVNTVPDRSAPPAVVTTIQGDVRAKKINFGIQHGRSS